jgi:hypothetical protein
VAVLLSLLSRFAVFRLNVEMPDSSTYAAAGVSGSGTKRAWSVEGDERLQATASSRAAAIAHHRHQGPSTTAPVAAYGSATVTRFSTPVSARESTIVRLPSSRSSCSVPFRVATRANMALS